MAWTATPPVLLSPEAALGWEFWNRYRRQLPLILLATCLFPACCGWYQFSVAYSRFKESRIWEPAVFVMPPRVHIAIVLITLAAVPLIVPSFAPLSRHYLLPVDTGRLTRTRWLLGAMAAALQSAAAFGFARIITRSDWPIIDPTIYAVLVFAIAQWIAVRFRDRKFWIAGTSVVAAAAVIAVVVNHFRMQPTLEEPWQDFAPLTPSQLTGIVGAIGLLFRLTMWDAEGDRCQTRAMSRHAESATPTSASVTLRPFRSSFGSLLSWEWRRNGWLYPIAVALGTFTVYAVCTFLFARDYQRSTPETIVRASGAELIAFWLGAMVVGPYVLVFTTATGRRVMAGKGTDAWPLTLPLTNRQIGYAAVLRALLSILLASVLAAGISLSFEAGTQFWLRMIGESTAADRLSSNWASGESMRRLWTTGPFLVVAAYTLCGVMESAILTGRRAMGGLLHLVQIGLWLVLFMVQVLCGAMSLPDWLIPLVLACLSLAAVGAAWRLNEVDSRGIFLSAA
ncbi:MAG: hypothetical protein IT428_12590, partial [Planctomycetaceae bacterium]|nr:hypothetical protein [Planctomycetaceae bacterium]